ncbi:SWI/SNF complex subunit SWI3B [Elaeis guineensis]|uniref:SWI/SNF complex subunit SWI3B n=1 Tax=Elaeis guineensis var. tenera TaxID=51953 RepID=A0A6I9QVB6_ELAGV|nr:SWI/SNF complex subunit SWI3B [Elaeis guineensis]
MATPPPPAQTPGPLPANTPGPPQTPVLPVTPAVKSETPSTDVAELLPAASPRTPEPSPAASYTITIPSCSGWFSFGKIHETERKILPEFFDGKSVSRNPRVYKYYRDSIIRRFRRNPSRKITFTEGRRGLIGDVGSIRRVFDFLEEWGLINYAPSAKPSLKEKREAEEALEKKESPKKLCSNCRSVCSIACFATDKADIILCARCFVRGNYRPGLSSTDFKRVDITEETKTDWTDKETLHLLEAILHYGEDWKKVAEHVGGRSEKDCVARFIKLPFGEQFLGPPEIGEDGKQHEKNDQVSAGHEEADAAMSRPIKRRHLTPLTDASNPIMAQVAFLSAMAGSDVVKAAAQAAISALYEVDLASISSLNEAFCPNGQPVEEVVEEAATEAHSQLEKELQDVEQSVSDVVDVQMKDIQDKIAHFEEVELQIERERLQLRYMKDLLFADHSTISQHKARLMFKGNDDLEKFRLDRNVT